MEKELMLNTLLNDDSYICWLRGDSTFVENKEWGQWYAESDKHQELTKKAKKFLSMPFKNTEVSEQDIDKKIEKLKEQISRLSQEASDE